MQKIKGKQIESVGLDQALMPDKLKVTKSVGEITIPAGQNYVEISKTVTETIGGETVTRDKTAWELISEMFQKDNRPVVTQPSITKDSQSPTESWVECGTSVTPTLKCIFNPGEYPFGSSDGSYDDPTATTPLFSNVTPSGRMLNGSTPIDTNPTIAADNKMTFASRRLQDNDVIKLEGSFTFGQSTNIPLTQLGNTSSEDRIAAGSVTLTAVNSAKAYRKIFYGMSTLAANLPITSAVIRALSHSTTNPYTASATLTSFNANEISNPTCIIIAIPNAYITSSRKGVKKVEQTNGLVTDITADFTKLSGTVNVNDANGENPVAYKIWISRPAAITSTNVYKVTLT